MAPHDADQQRVKSIFASALELEPAGRDAFLERECGGDEELRAEVESWLASYAESEGFIETPVFDAAKLIHQPSAMAGRRFGNFEIIREIGSGGMGAVYLARRTDGEFEQQVALKIVRQSIAESGMVERFRRERQILASLNHQNIAKLLDGGVNEEGLPYLAMEFIDGESITEYAALHNLDLNARLDLFLKVCSAVAYAHRNLIVHRDIKPGNILVTADGEPKLLDFGLAKLVDDGLASDDTQTQTAFRALTPAYASPEQLKGETLSTSSDIYSLGVVFYELIAGQRPFYFEGKSIDQIIRSVTGSAPVSPSQTEESRTLEWASRLRGDLDNVALKALRSEPDQRYASVDQFATDIDRHLKGLPISARPQTFRYRSTKFLSRHKFVAAAASIVMLTLAAGVGATVYEARQTERQRVKAEAVNAFLQTMLNYSDPSTGLSEQNGKETTVKDVLNEASKRLETTDLSGQPDIKAELLRIVGASYLSQGQYDLADKNLTAALALQRQLYGDGSTEILQTLVELGQLRLATGDNAGAAAIYDERVGILRQQVAAGTMNPTYLLVALNDYALVHRGAGNSAAAEALLKEALDLKPKIPPENRISVGIAESVYALVLSDRGAFDEAIAIVRKRIDAIRQQPNPETAELGANLNALGNFLTEKGELAEASQDLAQAEAIYRKLFNETYLPIGDCLRLQARVLYLQGNYKEAEQKIDAALEVYRRSARPQFINYPNALAIKGMIEEANGMPVDAERDLREAVRLRRESMPEGSFLRDDTEGSLGEFLMKQKRYLEAEPLLTKSYQDLTISQAPGSPRVVAAKARLDEFYRDAGKP